MTGWQPGRAEIAALIQRRHLERITGDVACPLFSGLRTK